MSKAVALVVSPEKKRQLETTIRSAVAAVRYVQRATWSCWLRWVRKTARSQPRQGSASSRSLCGAGGLLIAFAINSFPLEVLKSP